MRRSAARRAAVAVLALTAAVACTGDDEAGPPPEPRPSTSTTLVDRSGVLLTPVGGETTTSIVETGNTHLVGTVRGPAGPVEGATVRIERIVAGRTIGTDVLTNAEGAFELRGVPGGRYRVRAFLAPALAQTTAEVRFLDDGQEHRFDLVVDDQRGVVVRTATAPVPPLLDEAVNLVVLVASRTVDGDGVVRAKPLSGLTVEIAGLGRWVLRDGGDSDDPDDDSTTTTSLLGRPSTTTTTTRPPADPTARTDGSGRARFELRCVQPGAPGLTLRVPVTLAPLPTTTPPDPTTTAAASPGTGTTTESVTLDLPECIDPATTTTTTTAGESTTTTP